MEHRRPEVEYGGVNAAEAKKSAGTILIVDDEPSSGLMRSVIRALEKDGWNPVVVETDPAYHTGEDFELAALYAIETDAPSAVLLDVRFGDHPDDVFKGLDILRTITLKHPKLPVLMFTQYAQGPERERSAKSALGQQAPVDFVDKLASPDEVVIRLRRLVGQVPSHIAIGDCIQLSEATESVTVLREGSWAVVTELTGMKYQIVRELAVAWYKSPGQLVPFSTLERYSDGEDARASLRVRLREIKDALGEALGVRLGASDLIVNVRDRGYLLNPNLVARG